MGHSRWLKSAELLCTSRGHRACFARLHLLGTVAANRSEPVGKRRHPGVAVAFMIAGPATNLGELLALRRGLGRGAAAFYAVALICLAFAGGIVADRLVSPELIADATRASGSLYRQHHAHAHGGVLEQIAAEPAARCQRHTALAFSHHVAVAVCRGACLDDWAGNDSSLQAVGRPSHCKIGGKVNGEPSARRLDAHSLQAKQGGPMTSKPTASR